jgi:broad specificity phosphatase PhoE
MNIKEIYPYILSPYTIIISIISLIYIFREKISDYLLHQLIVLLHKYQKKRRPKRIILVRHGNSEANNNYDILKNIPDNKVHLSEKGISQAKAAGKRLKQLLGNESIQFYVSPYTRTKETYEHILESLKDNHSSCIYVSSIREQEYGNLQSEMERQFKEQKEVGVYFYRFKNGESGADVHARMNIFLQYLFRRILSIDYFSWDNIVIVSHQLTIKFFIMAFLNLPVSDFENVKPLGNAEYLVIEKNELGKYRIKDEDIFINKKE